MSNRNPRVTVQKPYEMLVGNLSQGSTPAEDGTAGKTIQDVTIRSRYEAQQVTKTSTGTSDRAGYGALQHTTEEDLAEAEASFTVSDNDFSGGAVIKIGDFTLVAGTDFAIGGTAGDTATNIANAVDNLPGYSGANAGADVTITGRKGVQGNSDVFEAISYGAVDNFTSIVAFGGGTPSLDGPLIS